MPKDGFKRKLAAILSADVEGYSRLMDDETATNISRCISRLLCVSFSLKNQAYPGYNVTFLPI